MTGGDDECAVTAASPLANIVDADAGTDTIHYDTSGGSFSTGAAAIGNLFLNFELAHVSGGNTLTLSFSPASPIDWTIDAGTTVAIVQGNGQLGSGAVNLNGTLDVGNNLPAVVGPLFGTGTVSLATGASLTLTGASWSPIFAGVIQGDGSITVNAASGDVQILSGANTYTGGTNIIGGALGVYSDANLGAASGGISFANGATLGLLSNGTYGAARDTVLGTGGGTLRALAANLDYASDISGSGDLIINSTSGSIDLYLSGNNTYSGATQLFTGGTFLDFRVHAAGSVAIGDMSPVVLNLNTNLVIDDSETIGSLASTTPVAQVDLLAFQTLTTGGNNTSSQYLGQFNGSGNLTKTGTGTFTVFSTQYTGLTTVAAGTLIQNGTMFGNLQINAGATYGGDAIVNGDVLNLGNISPGNSPTIMTFNAGYTGGGSLTMEVQFDNAGAPINGTTHDFLTIAGNVTGTTLINVVPLAPSGSPAPTTGNGIELVRVGGTVAANQFALSGPVTQGGIQYVLNFVPTAGDDSFFLQSLIRDELWAEIAMLATGRALTSNCFRAETASDPGQTRGERGRFWAKAGGGNLDTGADTGVETKGNFTCGAGGIDFASTPDVRIGLSGGYGRAELDVTTPGGIGALEGDQGIIEGYVSYARENVFANFTLGYATTDWTFDGAISPQRTATTDGLVGSALFGMHWPLGGLRLAAMGEVDYDDTTCGDDCFIAGSVEETSSWLIKGTLRLDTKLSGGMIVPYIAVSYVDDLGDGHTVSVGSTMVASNAASSLFQGDAGITAFIDERVALFAAAGITEGLDNDVSGVNGRGGVRVAW